MQIIEASSSTTMAFRSKKSVLLCRADNSRCTVVLAIPVARKWSVAIFLRRQRSATPPQGEAKDQSGGDAGR